MTKKLTPEEKEARAKARASLKHAKARNQSEAAGFKIVQIPSSKKGLVLYALQQGPKTLAELRVVSGSDAVHSLVGDLRRASHTIRFEDGKFHLAPR